MLGIVNSAESPSRWTNISSIAVKKKSAVSAALTNTRPPLAAIMSNLTSAEMSPRTPSVKGNGGMIGEARRGDQAARHSTLAVPAKKDHPASNLKLIPDAVVTIISGIGLAARHAESRRAQPFEGTRLRRRIHTAYPIISEDAFDCRGDELGNRFDGGANCLDDQINQAQHRRDHRGDDSTDDRRRFLNHAARDFDPLDNLLDECLYNGAHNRLEPAPPRRRIPPVFPPTAFDAPSYAAAALG